MKKTEKKKIVIVSGYFNPLHKGHVEMIENAHKLGKVVVIVNNDYQVKMKGSVPFMDQNERKYILESLKGVHDVWISEDKDPSVNVTLRKLVAYYLREKNKKGEPKYDFVFANGGDRKETKDILESRLCKQLRVSMTFKMGEKIQSSSKLISNARAYKNE